MVYQSIIWRIDEPMTGEVSRNALTTIKGTQTCGMMTAKLGNTKRLLIDTSVLGSTGPAGFAVLHTILQVLTAQQESYIRLRGRHVTNMIMP